MFNYYWEQAEQVCSACTGTAKQAAGTHVEVRGRGTRVFWGQWTHGLCPLWAVGFIS